MISKSLSRINETISEYKSHLFLSKPSPESTIARLLGSYYLRKSFVDVVLANMNKLEEKKEKLILGSVKGYDIMKDFGYINNKSREFAFLKLFDRKEYLCADDTISFSFCVHNGEKEIVTNEETWTAFDFNDQMYGPPSPVTGVKVRFKVNIREENKEFIRSLSDELTDSQVKDIIYCVYMRVFDHLIPRCLNGNEISVLSYGDKLYEILDENYIDTYFPEKDRKRHDLKILYKTDYKYFLIYNYEKFKETRDAYYLIQCASEKQKDKNFYVGLKYDFPKYRFLLWWKSILRPNDRGLKLP